MLDARAGRTSSVTAPAKVYGVEFTDEGRDALKALITKGRTAVRKLTHIRILLLTDERHEGDAMICQVFFSKEM